MSLTVVFGEDYNVVLIHYDKAIYYDEVIHHDEIIHCDGAIHKDVESSI